MASIPNLHFSEELPEIVRRELDQFAIQLRGYLLVSHNEDGSLRSTMNNDNPNVTINNTSLGASGGIEDEQWWKTGPWTLDDPDADLDNVVGLRPPDPPAGTYHNYAPPGIEAAVVLEIEPTGNITLTGIKRMTTARKRILLLRNRDSSFSITLKHDNTGSLVGNRFDLPGSVDIVLTARQNVWLYYDLGRAAWSAAITAQSAGGMSVGGGGSGDVVGPAGATDGNVVLFDTATGKLIKDSGISVATISLGANLYQASANLGTWKTGLTTATTLAAAPGAGYVIVPHSIDFIQSTSDDQFIQNAPITISVKYSGITGLPIPSWQISNALNRYTYFRQRAQDISFGVGVGKPGPPATTVDPHNQAVVIVTDKNIDYTGGGGVSEGKFWCALTYSIIAITNPVAS